MSACSMCGATGHPDWAKFCSVCGQSLATPSCGSCGTELMPGARFCSSCGAVQGDEPTLTPPTPVSPPATGPVSTRRITTVLFGDLVGFTSLSEVRDTEEVRELLSHYFEECRRIIGRYGGTVEKFIGDAVMAVWGVPTAHEDDAERAVRAGLELVSAVSAIGDDEGVSDLAMRVGLVTGEVAVTVGATNQGMVAGDPVNTASRVQSAADPGQVWVDETTKLLTSAAISYQDAGSHTLKGKAEPVPLWSARAVVASMGGASRADGLEAPFVGRDRQLRLVKEVFHSTAENGRGALLVVDGEPGVGKSRLGWEFFKYVDGLTADTYWHQGRCLAYGEGVAFWALSEAVRLRLLRLGDRPGDDEVDALELVAEGLQALGSNEKERAWLGPRLAALLGGGSIGTFARDELFAAWVTFFERVSAGTEIVFLVDDAHHADEGLLAFIEYLLETATFPCMVLLLTRPGLLERRPALATNRRAVVLHLPELEPRDMTALVNGLVAGLSDEVSAALVQRAEGVPLYAVETVRSLIDRDLVIPRGGRYVLADAQLDLSVVGAPASLQTLVAARLDALPAEQRLVVSQASILGSTFTLGGLRELCPGIDVDVAVAELVRLQIFTKDTNRLSVEFGQFKFVQSVVRQVAYGTLSRRDRKAGHLAAARYFQSTVEPGTELDAVMAQHFVDAKNAMPGESDVPELEAAAIELLIRAAERAASLGVPDDAAVHLRTAMDHASDPWTHADLERRLARALLDTGRRYDECIVHADRATAALDALGDEVSAGRAAAAAARALGLTGEATRAIELARPRFESLRGRDDAARAALELATALVTAEIAIGLDSRDTLDTRMRLAERLSDAGELADSLAGLSLHYALTGAPWISREFLEAAARLAREHDLPQPLSRALVNLTADRINFDLAEAIELGAEAMAVSTRSGDRSMVAFAIGNNGVALFNAGRWAELESIVTSGAELFETLFPAPRFVLAHQVAAVRGTDPSVPPRQELPASEAAQDRGWLKLMLAAEGLVLGDRLVAYEHAAEATQIFHSYGGTSDDFSHAFAMAGELAAELGLADRLDELLRLVDQGPAPAELSVRAHQAHLRGLRARMDGSPQEAESSLREAVDRFEEWGAGYWKARVQANLGTWLRDQGRLEEAEGLIAAARSVFAEIGAQVLLGQLDEVLDAAP